MVSSDARQRTMANRSKSSALAIFISVSALFTLLCSCIADTKYIAFTSIAQEGWSQADTLCYTIPSLGGVDRSSVSLLLQTEGYSYENIALDITIQQDTTLLYHELRSYLLCYSQPKRGIGNQCSYTLSVGNVSLCDTLPATITLVQQLDQPILSGIRKVGVRLGAPMSEPGAPVWKVDWH